MFTITLAKVVHGNDEHLYFPTLSCDEVMRSFIGQFMSCSLVKVALSTLLHHLSFPFLLMIRSQRKSLQNSFNGSKAVYRALPPSESPLGGKWVAEQVVAARRH